MRKFITITVMLILNLTLFGKTTLSKKPSKTNNFFPLVSWMYEDSWGLFQSAGNAHINIPDAWKLVPKIQTEVVIAVIDTGVDINHPDLKDSIWKNPNETCDNKLDDDSNGYIDDCYGVNLVEPTKLPLDVHRHGTHIAGIIAAKQNSLNKTSGVAPGVKIMPIKYFDEKASGDLNLKRTIEGLRYAVRMNADVINYSGGGPQASNEELELIKEALSKGILLIAAAGNESNNTDVPEKQFFPASYNLENIISVASINPYGQLLKSSNYGQKAIEVAAPGLSIKSTTPDGKFGYMTGTSQATAFVTGISALMLDIFKKKQNTLSKIEMMRLTREGILQGVKKSDLLKSKIKSGGIVDATASVKYALKISEGTHLPNGNQVVSKNQIPQNKREISNNNNNDSVKQIQKVIDKIATRPNP